MDHNSQPGEQPGHTSQPGEHNWPAQPDARAERLLERARTNGWPQPDDHSSAALRAWLGAAGPRDPTGVGRYLTEIWRERTDLMESFPGIAFDPAQRSAFLEWARHFAVAESDLPAVLVPAGIADAAGFADAGFVNERPTEGVTIIGFLRAQLGIGAAARRVVELCRRIERTVQSIPYDHVGSPLTVDWPDVAQESIEHHDITILCVNGSELPRLVRALGPHLPASTYRIGLWFWEVETLSAEMALGLAHCDEVWVTSMFVADAVRRHLDATGASKPVHILPLGADIGSDRSGPIDADRSWQRIGDPSASELPVTLPHGLTIGFAFDFASRAERKNPIGVVRAFTLAFPTPFALGPHVGPWLVVKTHGSAGFDNARAELLGAIAERPDVRVIDGDFTDNEQHGFYRSLDVFISLHRAEGYGLAMLEAMALGVPTIATAFGGNLEFMRPENSWLVPAERVPVPPDCGQYPAGSLWAEPDIDAAASALREVVGALADPDANESRSVIARAMRGQDDMADLVSGATGAAWIRGRLAAIRATVRQP